MTRHIRPLIVLVLIGCADQHPSGPPNLRVVVGEAESARREQYLAAAKRTIDDEFESVARDRVSGFAGFYFDAAGHPVVLLTDTSRRGGIAQWADSTLNILRMTDRALRFRQADYDWVTLQTWRNKFRGILVGRHGMLDINEARNRITIGLRNLADSATIISEALSLDVPRSAFFFQRRLPRHVDT